MKPEELLDLFSVDKMEDGGVMFRAYTWNLWKGMDGPHAIAEVCKVVHMPRPAVYARMKKALAPVFEADPETLKALGLRPQKTTVGLARELVKSMPGGMEHE